MNEGVSLYSVAILRSLNYNTIVYEHYYRDLPIYYWIVMIYLNPPKVDPAVLFFLKYLDPSEIFYPPIEKLPASCAVPGVQIFQLN